MEVKRIKALFQEQETEIEDLKKEAKEHISQLEANEKRIKDVRIELTLQVKENESTVKRYRKMIQDEKQFAIGKFAVDL